MDLTKLKKLASVCRKAGILHYKDSEFEFTLAQDFTPTSKRPRANLAAASLPSDFVEDAPPEDLLFWSSQSPMPDQAQDEVA